MNAKQQIALVLEQAGDAYASGSGLAAELGLTRAAVWKCIGQLSAEGYDIERSKRGYRLGENSDALSENSVQSRLGELAETFELESFEPQTLGISFLRKGVIGVSKIGYVTE